ncbi:MAG: alginate export family protein [Nitrospira sp.]|nr:alginate export family protein [Nitrospira sp.]
MRSPPLMIPWVVVLLGFALWSLLPLPVSVAKEATAPDSPTADRTLFESVGETAGEIGRKAHDAPKEVKDYFFEKVHQAEQEPWRETADEILIERSQVRWHRYLRALADTPEWLDIGLSHRLRYESLSNNFRKDQDTTINGMALRTRLRIGADWKIFRFLLEGQNSTDAQESSGTTDTLNGSLFSRDRLLQGFLAVRLDNVFSTGLRTDLHLGRMTMDFGDRRLIARNDFRNTTNTFQGLHWNLSQEEVWRTRAFLVKPVAETFGVLQPVTDTLFWGVQYEDRREPWMLVDLYYFGIKGGGDTGQRNFGTYGVRYFRSPEVEQLDYNGETIFQVGTRNHMDHFAYFQHFEVGYTLRWFFTPRVSVLYDYASGTSDPASGKSGTFDTLFGARRAELNPSSIFGPFFRSNISSPGLRLDLHTARQVDMTVKWRVWHLAQSKDAWVGSGLQDSTGAAGNYLGQDVEIRARWHIGTYLSFDAGYDHFFKGSYVTHLAQTPGNPPAKDSDYFYLQSEFRF